MRISRAVALAGIASRRKSEEHVRNGAVTVNGEVVQDLGRQVDIDDDVIAFRGRALLFNQFVYFMLNKPKGYTTTAQDKNAKKSVFELLPRNLMRSSRQPSAKRTRVFPVGRLDRDTLGLLLFTNDGKLAHRLMHPKFEIEKVYEVRLGRPFDAKHRKVLKEGVKLEDGPAHVKKLKSISPRTVQVTVAEGRNRLVRRLFEALGYKIVRLTRLRLGPLNLANLPVGRGRLLSAEEKQKLEALATG